MPIFVIHGIVHIRERGKYKECWIYVPTEDLSKLEKFNRKKIHFLVMIDDL